jgi:NDP-sugar pyrophosphorylase family protein
MSLPVAILAGGLATRLYPLTLSVPKSLLEVAGRPFVACQIERLVREGFPRIVLCLGKHGEMVQEALGDGSSLGAQVEYAFDGPRLLGTGWGTPSWSCTAIPTCDATFRPSSGPSATAVCRP